MRVDLKAVRIVKFNAHVIAVNCNYESRPIAEVQVGNTEERSYELTAEGNL